jgi:hypothetical protein
MDGKTHTDTEPDAAVPFPRMRAAGVYDWSFTTGPRPKPAAHWSPTDPEQWHADFSYDDPTTGRRWRFEVSLAERPTHVDVTDVRLSALDGLGMTGDSVRNVPWGTIISDLRSDFAQSYLIVGLPETAAKLSARPRRAAVTTDLLEQVAHVYKVAAANGSSPTQAVAEALNLNRSTAGKWVVKARRAGLIPPTTQGKFSRTNTETETSK